MAEGVDPDPNTFLVSSSEIQDIENAPKYAKRKEKQHEELSTDVKSLNTNNEKASKEDMTDKEQELHNLQDEMDHLKEENENQEDFMLTVEHSIQRVKDTAQQSSSGKLQPGSGKKQEIKSPSHDSPLEEQLRARKVSVNNRELLIAAGEGDLGKSQNLIQQGLVDVDFADRDGNTSLHYAVEKGNVKVINLLIESNAKIDVENKHSETSFDVALRWKNEEIIREFEKNIVDRSIVILQDTKKATVITYSQKSSGVEEEVKITDVEMIEKLEIEKTKKKINGLLQLLKEGEKKGESDYKKAMIFILFIETFAFQGSGEKCIRDNLREYFLNNWKKEKEIKKCSQIEQYRSLFLKSKEKFYEFNDINNVIKMGDFFSKLKQHLSRYMEHEEKIDIEILLLEVPPHIKSSTGSKSGSDPYSKLIDLVSEVCKKGVDLHKQWFEFILNIYPKLKEESSDLRKQIDHLRNNLIHSFYDYGVDEFREAVFNLRGKLLEYSYAKQVDKDILNSLIDKDPAEIEKKLEEKLQEVENNFIGTEGLSSDEADQLFGYRVVKCLYYPLAKEPSQQEALYRGLVIDYWRYLIPIDLVEEQRSSNKLSGVNRRKLFEKFIALKRTKRIFPYYYFLAKKRLKKEVEKYGCINFNKICKSYVENDLKLDEKTNVVVDKIVKFISITQNAKEILGFRGESIISFVRDILEVQDEDVKKLVLTQSQSLNRMKEELEKQKAEGNQEIKQLMDLKKYFKKVYIENKNGNIQIVERKGKKKKKKKVKQLKMVMEAVINIVETLYNAYNEYKVDFDLKEIFASRSFLNELIEKIKDNIPIIIERLIDIDYMSPLVSSLILKESTKVTNNTNLEKLIDHMLDSREYADYLKNLLKVECYGEFKFYEKFYHKVCEKNIDIQNISTIFKEPKNIEEFIGVLVNKYKESSDDWQEKNKIIKLAKSLLEIINEEIAERYYYKNTDFNPSEVLESAEEINTLKDEIGRVYPNFSGFAVMSLLKAKIKSQEANFQEALDILENLEKHLENNASLKASYLLTLSDIAYIYKLQNKYADAQKKYTVLYNEIIRYSLKLKLGSKASKINCTLYKEVKDSNEYKNLLQHSELLHSENYLNILNVLSDIAHMTSKFGEENSNIDSINKALDIYQEVYRFQKEELGSDNEKDIQILSYIADSNKEIGYIHKKKKQYSDALSYLQNALIKYIIVYDAMKIMLGDNHKNVLQIAGKIICTLGAFTHNKLAQSISLNNSEQSLKIYKEACKMYQDIIMVQRRILSEKDSEIEESRENLKSIKAWMNNLVITP